MKQDIFIIIILGTDSNENNENSVGIKYLLLFYRRSNIHGVRKMAARTMVRQVCTDTVSPGKVTLSIKSKDIVFFLLKVYNKGIEIDAQNGEEG